MSGRVTVLGEAAPRFLSLKRTAAWVGCSPSTVLRWERDGKFPDRRRLGPNRVGWDIRELEAWASEREPVSAAPSRKGDYRAGR